MNILGGGSDHGLSNLRKDFVIPHFFHAWDSAGRNKIDGPLKSNNRWKEGRKEIATEVCNYFTNLFISTNPSRDSIDDVISGLEPRVIEDMNQMLDKPFTTKEIRRALFQMHPYKARGPDGLNAEFFQKYWHIIGESVTNVCFYVMNDGEDISYLSKTYIALISKIKEPKRVSEFRRINLCNIIYKIIIKTLANRLKLILEK